MEIAELPKPIQRLIAEQPDCDFLKRFFASKYSVRLATGQVMNPTSWEGVLKTARPDDDTHPAARQILRTPVPAAPVRPTEPMLDVEYHFTNTNYGSCSYHSRSDYSGSMPVPLSVVAQGTRAIQQFIEEADYFDYADETDESDYEYDNHEGSDSELSYGPSIDIRESTINAFLEENADDNDEEEAPVQPVTPTPTIPMGPAIVGEQGLTEALIAGLTRT